MVKCLPRLLYSGATGVGGVGRRGLLKDIGDGDISTLQGSTGSKPQLLQPVVEWLAARN